MGLIRESHCAIRLGNKTEVLGNALGNRFGNTRKGLGNTLGNAWTIEEQHCLILIELLLDNCWTLSVSPRELFVGFMNCVGHGIRSLEDNYYALDCTIIDRPQ